MPEHPLPRMIRMLAESIVDPRARQASIDRAALVASDKDPKVRPPSEWAQTGGMTAAQTASKLLGLVPKAGGLSGPLKQSLVDTIRVVLKGIPKQALRSVDDLYETSPRMSGYSDRITGVPFEKSQTVGGAFNPIRKEVQLSPTRNVDYLSHSVDEVIPHEYGHASIDYINDLLAKRAGVTPDSLNSVLYTHFPHEQEPMADVLGMAMRRKAGLADPRVHRPRSQYAGGEAEDSEFLQKVFMNTPAVNPYLRARRMLENQMKALNIALRKTTLEGDK